MTPEEQAADVLDAAIDDVIAGRLPAIDSDVTQLLHHMVAVHRAPVPAGLVERARPSPTAAGTRRARLAAAVLGVLLIWHGVPNVVAGAWLARWLGLGYEPHIYREVGIVLIAVGAVVLAGALRPGWLTTAVRVGVPVGAVLGVWGLVAIGGAPNPAAEMLHVMEGTAAAALAWTFWRWRTGKGRAS